MVDACALVEFLLGTDRGQRFKPVLTSADVDLHAPALCDVEVAATLRKLEMRRLVVGERARSALVDYLDMPVTVHGHRALMLRVHQLRANITSYDAVYVALAESMAAGLLTADAALRKAVARHTSLSLVG